MSDRGALRSIPFPWLRITIAGDDMKILCERCGGEGVLTLDNNDGSDESMLPGLAAMKLAMTKMETGHKNCSEVRT